MPHAVLLDGAGSVDDILPAARGVLAQADLRLLGPRERVVAPHERDGLPRTPREVHRVRRGAVRDDVDVEARAEFLVPEHRPVAVLHPRSRKRDARGQDEPCRNDQFFCVFHPNFLDQFPVASAAQAERP